MEPRKNYLLFAIVDNGEAGDSLPNRELEEQREELAKGIFAPERSRVALVLLRDSLVGVVVTNKPVVAHISRPIAKAVPLRRRGY